MKNNLKQVIIFIFVFAFGLALFICGYRVLLKSIYPIKYEDVVNSLSKEYNMEPELIYAVIKTESGFDENAVSSAGAMGLMQITPKTFEWLQTNKKGPIEDVEETKEIKESGELFDSQVNIRYGVFFLNILKKKYNSETLMLCAYNAGMSAVDRWLKEGKLSYYREEFENVPYKETRNYVKRVKKCKEMYKMLYF